LEVSLKNFSASEFDEALLLSASSDHRLPPEIITRMNMGLSALGEAVIL
jgi:hypothetical protein